MLPSAAPVNSSRIVQFPAGQETAAAIGKDLPALLKVWTPREWFHHGSSTEIPMAEAMRRRRKCGRFQVVPHPRLSRIA
jgi:hypothetical protein